LGALKIFYFLETLNYEGVEMNVCVETEQVWTTCHPQVRVKHGPLEADVDVEIAPLIKELWRAGVDTVMSCQDNTAGRVWIQFFSSQSLERFLNIVGEYEEGEGSLYDRIQSADDCTTRPDRGGWWYSLCPSDVACDEEDDHDEEAGADEWLEPQFAACLSVRFPRADLPTVLQRLKQFNRMSTILLTPVSCNRGLD
jgi:hypothetical protein